jgi:hypothetical protein
VLFYTVSVDTNAPEEQAAYTSRAKVIMLRVMPWYTGRVTENTQPNYFWRQLFLQNAGIHLQDYNI